jgi:hypothetical protein
MAIQLEDGSWGVRLGSRIESLPQGEHRDLRLADEAAWGANEVTWLANADGDVTSAVVPAAWAARALRAFPLA